MSIPSDWQTRRHRALHMTIRDVDCADFDVERTIATFQRWNVTLFSFFAGGYVTTYPTRLPWQRVSAHLAPGRDLCGEILTAAHRAGIVAFPMIDLGEVPLELAEAHPEWIAQRADGSPYVKTDGIAVSCPLGPYRRELARELVTELRDRYGRELVGIKWGGASYGFSPGVDHNPIAAEAFLAASGRSRLPESLEDPAYAAWRRQVVAETAAHLRAIVREIADIPVVGNSVWQLGEGFSLEMLTPGQDFTQVEVQTRTHATPDGADVAWERFTFPTETSRYVSACCRNAPWVVASYFLAWPWRRVAVPPTEQKLYLAQIAANGASPMVNLTTGSPDHHDDPRGFRAIEDLYGFMARHDAWYQGDRSAAQVAIVYDHPSALAAGVAGNRYRLYLDELHTIEETLDRWHVPYDILSTEMLLAGGGGRLRALVLPSPQAIGEPELRRLAELRAAGVAVIVTGSLPENRPAERLAAACGVAGVGSRQPFHQGAHLGPLQAYARLGDHAHPLLDGMDGIPLLAVAGHWQPVRLGDSAPATPVHRAATFRLFPEGLSYADAPDPGEPLAICSDGTAGARAVVFAFELGRTIRKTGHPDPERLLVNALAWATRDAVQPICPGFRAVRLSLRRTAPGLALHLINATGRSRHLTEITPLRDLPLAIPTDLAPTRVTRASDGAELPFTRGADGRVRLVLPSLGDYDLLQLHAS